MKKFICFLFISFVLAGVSFAHPPSDIQINIDKDKLDIIIKHSVENVSQHYINLVDVKLNDKSVINQKFSIQRDKETQTLIYVIPGLKANDKVVVQANCNIFGDKKQDLLVK